MENHYHSNIKRSWDLEPDRILKILLGFLIAFNIFILLSKLDNTIYDWHEFRQAQVLLTIYWFFEDFNLFSYITPCRGYPWAIPMEFPFYQLLAACLAKVLPFLSLEAVGRIVSSAFNLAAIYPLWKIAFRYTKDTLFSLTILCLYLAMPFYIYWAATVLPNSCALFFCLLFLWALIRLGDHPTVLNMIWASAWGVMAINIMPTFIISFGIAGYLHIFIVNRKTLLTNKKRLAILLFPGLISCVTVLVWLSWSNALKSSNPRASMMSSANWRWYFGTLGQRLDNTWWHLLWDRLRIEHLSTAGLASLSVMALYMRDISERSKNLLWAAVCFFFFMLPIMAMFGMHVIHNIYQAQCNVFLIGCIAFLIYPNTSNSKMLKLFSYMLGAVCLIMLWGFKVSYIINGGFPSMYSLALPDHPLVAQDIKENTPEDSCVIIYATWSPDILFYAQRKGLSYNDEAGGRDIVTLEYLNDTLKNGMGGLPLGAVAVRNTYVPRHEALDEFIASLDNPVKKDIGTFTIYYLTSKQ